MLGTGICDHDFSVSILNGSRDHHDDTVHFQYGARSPMPPRSF